MAVFVTYRTLTLCPHRYFVPFHCTQCKMADSERCMEEGRGAGGGGGGGAGRGIDLKLLRLKNLKD